MTIFFATVDELLPVQAFVAQFAIQIRHKAVLPHTPLDIRLLQRSVQDFPPSRN